MDSPSKPTVHLNTKENFPENIPKPAAISTGYATHRSLIIHQCLLSPTLLFRTTFHWHETHQYHWCKADHYHCWCNCEQGAPLPPLVQDCQGWVVHGMLLVHGTLVHGMLVHCSVDIPRRRVLPPTCCVMPVPTSRPPPLMVALTRVQCRTFQ